MFGGSLVNVFFFIRNRGRVFFWQGKKLLRVASILYIHVQAKLPVKINLNYLQVSKYYIKKLSPPN